MTDWTPAPQIRQMDGTIEVGEIGNTDLISAKIKVGRRMWRININVGGPLTLIHSVHDMHIPNNQQDPKYRQAVQELERAISYMRSAVTFAFETPTKRGFEGFIGEVDDFFPSTRPKTAYKQSTKSVAVTTQVLEDVGKKYSKKLHQLLEYWRRGFELGEMWYYSESYLNYYKILETMTKQVNAGSSPTYAALKRRFNTDTKFKQRYGFNEKDVIFAAKVFAFLGYKRVTIPMFRLICKIARVRNQFNVGHTRAITKGGYYSAIGQFSDDFDLTQIEGETLRELTRVLILHSLGYKKYWLDGSSGPYILRIQASHS